MLVAMLIYWSAADHVTAWRGEEMQMLVAIEEGPMHIKQNSSAEQEGL